MEALESNSGPFQIQVRDSGESTCNANEWLVENTTQDRIFLLAKDKEDCSIVCEDIMCVRWLINQVKM